MPLLWGTWLSCVTQASQLQQKEAQEAVKCGVRLYFIQGGGAWKEGQ